MPPRIQVKALRLVVLLLGLSAVGKVNAQIADDTPSEVLIAIQCAVSSGGSADDYREYGRRLSKTLSLLSADQQERVFGFLPSPGGITPVTIAEALQSDSSISGAASGGGGNSIIDPLVGAVGDMNDELFGPAPVPPPIIAGTPPDSPPATTDPLDDGNNGDGNSGGSDPGNPGNGDAPTDPETIDPLDDGNNGHGNSGGFDPSNPGNGNGNSSNGNGNGDGNGQNDPETIDPLDDGNNGHGNSGGSDPSNPGNGGGNSSSGNGNGNDKDKKK